MEKKILIVDDNVAHNEIMVDLFKEMGYTNVVTATTGAEGVKACAIHKPTVVILDTMLPDIIGFDVCKAIRQECSPADTKIIIMTGFISAVDVTKAQQMGADEFVVKTSDFSYLLDVVKKLLSEVN